MMIQTTDPSPMSIVDIAFSSEMEKIAKPFSDFVLLLNRLPCLLVLPQPVLSLNSWLKMEIRSPKDKSSSNWMFQVKTFAYEKLVALLRLSRNR